MTESIKAGNLLIVFCAVFKTFGHPTQTRYKVMLVPAHPTHLSLELEIAPSPPSPPPLHKGLPWSSLADPTHLGARIPSVSRGFGRRQRRLGSLQPGVTLHQLVLRTLVHGPLLRPEASAGGRGGLG